MATPYMGLDLPTPTVTAGPTYATQNNSAFEVIDAHDHTPGKGAPIPTAGLAINADLTFANFNAIDLRSARFTNHGSPLSDPSDLTCFYASAGNLYWNNGAGQQVQLTAGGALNAASIGGIGGDYSTSTASVFYTTATTKFTFWQNANTAALMDQGATTIRDTGASANGVTVLAPSGLAANYSLTFPSALPASTKIMTIDDTGAIGAAYGVDDSTLEISSNTIRVKDGGITTAKLAAGAVTPAKLSGFTSGSGTGSVINGNASSYTSVVSATFTASGSRPIEIVLMPNNPASESFIGLTGSAGVNTIELDLKLDRDGTDVAIWVYQVASASASWTASGNYSTSGVRFIDFSPATGSTTYTLKYKVTGTASPTGSVANVKLVAFEKV